MLLYFPLTIKQNINNYIDVDAAIVILPMEIKIKLKYNSMQM